MTLKDELNQRIGQALQQQANKIIIEVTNIEPEPHCN
jgi:hypothetical protein